MVNVCGLAVYGLAGLASGSILAYRLRGGEGDRGDLHWLDSQGLGQGGAGTGRSSGPRDCVLQHLFSSLAGDRWSNNGS